MTNNNKQEELEGYVAPTFEVEELKLDFFNELNIEERYDVTKAFESNLFDGKMMMVVSATHFFKYPLNDIAKKLEVSLSHVMLVLEESYEAIQAVEMGYKVKQARCLHTSKATTVDDFLNEVMQGKAHPLMPNKLILKDFHESLNIPAYELVENTDLDAYKSTPVKIYDELPDDAPEWQHNTMDDWIYRQNNNNNVYSWDSLSSVREKDPMTPMTRADKRYLKDIAHRKEEI